MLLFFVKYSGKDGGMWRAIYHGTDARSVKTKVEQAVGCRVAVSAAPLYVRLPHEFHHGNGSDEAFFKMVTRHQ